MASQHKIASTGISETDRIEQWFYAPIKEQQEHRGFTILMLIIPIYERYLRHICQNEAISLFSSNNCELNEIAHNLGINSDQAKRFWQIMRNGLLHRSTPKQTISTSYALTDAGPPISEPTLGQLLINPYAVRPLLLTIFRSNPAFWGHSDYPVPDEVVVSDATQRSTAHYTQTRPYIP